jgi:predicted N-acetyltransferase YhbS
MNLTAKDSDLANSDYRRELGDGLVLRWSRAEDADGLAALIGAAFRHQESDPPNARMATWTREMLSGRHPLIGPDGFALVEDAARGEIVSGACLLSEAWDYEGVTLPVGRPEVVATHAAYRQRGLIRAIFELLHARSVALGHVLQVITGISWYYRQFGYTYAVELPASASLPVSEIPPLAPGVDEPYMLRAATVADIPELARLYDEERAGALVSTPISVEYWRWAIEDADPQGDAFLLPWMLIERAGGAVAGYALSALETYRGALRVDALWLRRGMWLSALPSLMRGLKAVGASLPAHRVNDTAYSAIALSLPRAHPAHAALRALTRALRDLDDSYAWYVRAPDLPALLRRLAPALERRLDASPFAGYSGELIIDLYRDAVRLVFAEGRLVEAQARRAPATAEPRVGMPPDVFPQLLFGYRDLAELRYAYPDVTVRGAALALLPVLFPKRASWALPLG